MNITDKANRIKTGLEAITGMSAKILTYKEVYGKEDDPESALTDLPTQVHLVTPTGLVLLIVHLYIDGELEDFGWWEQDDTGDIACLGLEWDKWNEK